MKKLLLLLAILCPILGFSTHIEVSGTISTNTTWTGVDTVFVIGNVTVNDGVTLTIDPGIYVVFQGHYRLKIDGRLLAIGTETDIIKFTVADTTGYHNNTHTGWNRIYFDRVSTANDSSKIVYCILEYGKATYSGAGGPYGGALFVYEYDKVLVSHSTFRYNWSEDIGGGLFCSWSNIMISHNLFQHNGSEYSGGALYIYEYAPYLINNLIINNYISSDAIYMDKSDAIFINNTIASNCAGIFLNYNCDPTFINNILYHDQGDEIYLADNSCDPNFYYCDIEGGLEGFGLFDSTVVFNGDYEHCINADPQFVHTGVHHYDLKATSPCINRGNPNTTTEDVGLYDFSGEDRIQNGRIDIGAYETKGSPDGYPGFCLEFDGLDDYVAIDPLWNASPSSFTCEGWIYPEASNDNVLFYHGDKGEFMLELHSGTLKLKVNLENSGWHEASMSSFPINEWTHVACTWKKNNLLILYVNGELKSETPVPDEFLKDPGSGFQSCFASYHATGAYYNGKVDEFSIWNVERSITEIRENINLTLNGTESGLLNYWQFNEGTDTVAIAVDVVSGNNGRLTNMDTSSCWIISPIPIGAGESVSQIVSTTGIVGFEDASVQMDFEQKTGIDTIVVTRIDTAPNIKPDSLEAVFDKQYWVIHKYGNGTFSADLTYEVIEDFTSGDEYNPNKILLYSRHKNADTDWILLAPADTVDAFNHRSTFEGITSYRQFLIGREHYVNIAVKPDPLGYGSVYIGGSTTGSIVAYNYGNDTLVISDVSTISSNFTPDITECTVLPNDSCSIIITFTPSNLGSVNDTVTIVNNDPLNPEKKVSILAKVITADGYPGDALDFDGDNDYVDVSHHNGLPIYSSDTNHKFTICMWVNGDAQYHKKVFAESNKYYNLSYHFTIGTSEYGKVYLDIQNSDDLYFTQESSKTAFNNEWHHIAWVDENNNQKLYIDGVQDPENFHYSRKHIPLNKTSLGALNMHSTQDYFLGKVDELQLWTEALSETEIREDMHKTLTGTESDLLSYFQFNEGSGLTAHDYIGNNNGTLHHMDTTGCWIKSTVATGPGVSNTQTESAGNVDFQGTGLSMYYNSQNGASVTVTRIDTTPNIYPAGPDSLLYSQYWVVHRYGSGDFDADMTFSTNDNLTTADYNNPANIALYTRPFNADTNWALLATASSVDTVNNKVTFTGITDVGQFIISNPAGLHVNPLQMTGSDIIVFPNPSTGTFYIRIKDLLPSQTMFLEVYNSMGLLVSLKTLVNDGTYSIDLSSYAAGLYFMKFQDSDKILMKKLIKY